MSEKEAWLKIAEAWDRATKCNCCSDYFAHFGDNEANGLCESIDHVVPERRESMKAPIKALLPKHNVFVWPKTLDGAKHRAAFCRKMAKECK